MIARTLYPFFSSSPVSLSFSSPSSRGVNLLKILLRNGNRNAIARMNSVITPAKARISQSPSAWWTTISSAPMPVMSASEMMNFLIWSMKKVFGVIRLNPYFSSIFIASIHSKGSMATSTSVSSTMIANSCMKSDLLNSPANAACTLNSSSRNVITKLTVVVITLNRVFSAWYARHLW